MAKAVAVVPGGVSRLMKNSSRHPSRPANPSSALRFLAVAMATAAKPRLDLESACRAVYQNEFFNSLLEQVAYQRRDWRRFATGRKEKRCTGVGPREVRAARCSGLPYPLCAAKP